MLYIYIQDGVNYCVTFHDPSVGVNGMISSSPKSSPSPKSENGGSVVMQIREKESDKQKKSGGNGLVCDGSAISPTHWLKEKHALTWNSQLRKGE